MSPGYRADIDGLRAVAVMLVVLYHYFPNHLPAGFVGVDVFFVISGYLISGIVLGQIERGTWSYTHFYERRVLRIFPALAVVLAANLALGWYALLASEFSALGKHVAGSAAFASNFVLWAEAGYFDVAAETKLLLHLWSLAIEEQFYLLWPVLLAVSLRGRRHFVAAVLVFAIVSFLAGVYASGRYTTAAYYSPLSRGWQLAAGGLLAYAHVRGRLAPEPRHGNALALAGIALLGAAVLLIDRQRDYPGFWALLPTVGSTLLIAAGRRAVPNRTLLSWRPAVWVGLISYPLYLWHWPLLVWARLLHFSNNLPASWRIGLIAVAFLLAAATFILAERPLRQRLGRPTVVGLCLAMVTLGLLGALAWTRAWDSRMGGEAAVRIVQAAQDWAYPPRSFRPAVRFRDYNFYRRDGAGRGVTLFVGDSNLEQYAPRIEAVMDRNAGTASVVIATKGGCPFALPSLAAISYDCRSKLPEVEALLRSDAVHTVVFVQAWKNLAALATDADLAAELESRIAGLGGKRVFLVLNMPTGLDFGPSALLGGSRLSQLEYRADQAQPVSAARVRAPFVQIDARLRDIAARTGAIVVDPYDTFCPGGSCPIVDDAGTPLYKDSAHLTATHARAAASFIDAMLTPP